MDRNIPGLPYVINRCPFCGHGPVHVRSTRGRPHGTPLRFIQCPSCGHTWKAGQLSAERYFRCVTTPRSHPIFHREGPLILPSGIAAWKLDFS